MKKRICILSFSPIYRDARVLRQIKYLSPHYDLSVIGYGPPHPNWINMPNIKWISLNGVGTSEKEMEGSKKRKSIKELFIERYGGTLLMKIVSPMLRGFRISMAYLIIFSGRLNSKIYDRWYWRNKSHRRALEYALQIPCQAFHSNDWEALPVTAEAAKQTNGKLLFDAHEYAPLELENRHYWKLIFKPAITYFLKKYIPQINASVTVAPLISERFKQEFNLEASVILNAPENINLIFRPLDFDNIRLVHHGGAVRDRRLERMIETLAFCDRRFNLHFILIDNDSNYSRYLKRLADKLTPGRVTFHEQVLPGEIVQRISEYDIGFYLLEPNSFNNIVALPNKFFDFISAGLIICIGPSPSMAELLRKYGFGVVAPSFDPKEVAKTLNQLSLDQLSMMRLASQKAAKEINAEKEMSKLVDLYNRLLNSKPSSF
jgi:glycosyltransferase involved in cell wall biosynthesis